MARLFLCCLLGTLLVACSNTNHVQRLVDDNSVIKYRKNSHQQVFQNLYPTKVKERIYPVTCEENCYPKSSDVKCKLDAEDCTFTGHNEKTELQTGIEIQWLGHASFYIKTSDESSFLLDPITKQFDSPVSFAHWLTGGIYRNEPKQWLSEQQLKDVDAIMYSHIHYDHFNKADIDNMERDIKYLVPLGFAKHFENDNFHINEMAWYSSTNINDTPVSFVPANHFSGRILVPFIYNDFNQSLWGGWLIEHKDKKLFFAGDTGYSKHFKDIKERYGAMDICLMPIASYHHEEDGDWYRYVHLTPEDALVAADELECKVMIPWGYGNNSWKMGDKSSHSPLLRLLHMHKKMDSKVSLYILNEGEKVRL
ncbi:MBL fold metallo-hydrolase [Parashewanella tropica]|uniref:MBL fold metallo-hydrolase n=1 Tax=Parashewanella tropica TaxID=2547970 RepID=UPI00105AA252|nr:MBL fold metallo-hydrolase [Parashewanella tropica]